MNKREAVLRLLDPNVRPRYVPAAFFMHFGERYKAGQAAVEKHLEYFRATGMDFVKIQYEHTFPHLPQIERPEDWRRMPFYDEDFYVEPLAVVEGLVKAAKQDALVIVTLYSPFMCAGHTTSDRMITDHLKQDPEAVKPGLEIITESLLVFVRACVRLGVDGFYASTQGGEGFRFTDLRIFDSYIKPYDLALMQEANESTPFNILHVCDYHGGYRSLSPYPDYPGDVVNCSLQLEDRHLTPRQAAEIFARPFMGGLDRHGVIASGDQAAIRRRVEDVLDMAPERFILGADCTVPGDTGWGDIRVAVEIAHAHGRGGGAT
ncbi:MAG: uroporphyrinogen decarboxylase family protein [Anaerolineae bacterium]